MKAFVFPGQGSQHSGMGETLFDEFPGLTVQADRILGYSIKQLCLEDPQNKLGQTAYTQPALYVVNALSYMKRVREMGTTPDFVAGHSLGEFNALLASGVFDFETGLLLVQKRGELMNRVSGGGMAAVLGLEAGKVRQVLSENGLGGIDIANLNMPTQIVVSGLKQAIEQAMPFLETAGARMVVPLNVSGAFHSRYMEEARQQFSSYLDRFEFKRFTIPVISNVHARPYRQVDIKRNLADQITHTVNWTDSIRYMRTMGVEDFEEIGPGRVLTKLVDQIRMEEPLLDILPENDLDDSRPEPDGREKAGGAPAIPGITAADLGDAGFIRDYRLKAAYYAGGMHHGISSVEMTARLSKAGYMGFLGTKGLGIPQIADMIQSLQLKLNGKYTYGVNVVHDPFDLKKEEAIVDLLLHNRVKVLEAASFIGITRSLVLYRAAGLSRKTDGSITAGNKLIAKVSRPEVADAFMSPAPEPLLQKLTQDNSITGEQADQLRNMPMADDICVLADSGGPTDHGSAWVLLPVIRKLRDELMSKYGYARRIRVGSGGGIGVPEASAAAFMMGADFVMTGSINQCTVEAETSDAVKDLLQRMNVQDVTSVPQGDLFHIGAQAQVLKRGLFFPARANKLYELYRLYDSLEDMDNKDKSMVQERYFKRSFEEIYHELKLSCTNEELMKAERDPKYKMALVFKWYFDRSDRLARSGSSENKVDYQIYCGPAMGAFNRWVKDTDLEDWRRRHVDQIADKLMKATADWMNEHVRRLGGSVQN
ncbi:ACP S-malonyltransferase (plasmid) [Paenibacillus sonchi]|uniref:[acyl-carrier-protein] S-malonyltransferase n=2 Tax=Paenibacillus sonchi TaxID=373687 RepID=A0A974PJC4_9BACL|nr:ACP S-malonyltransferase [Paenibacillus sonchi]QQZ64658.1 ACP S-malonyltransferase [Paenibacillus sonchi]